MQRLAKHFRQASRLTIPRSISTLPVRLCSTTTGGDAATPLVPAKKMLDEKLKIMEKPTCRGCGIRVQFDDVNQIGYCPPSRLQKLNNIAQVSKLSCQRCFQIRHHGQLVPAALDNHEYERSVRELRSKDMVVLQVIDLLDIEGSMLAKHRHLFGKKPVIFVATKLDLMPPISGSRRLTRRILQLAKEMEIENVLDVHLVSAVNRNGINDLLQMIQKHRQGRDICVVGAANAGKSSFLNAFLKHLQIRSVKVGGESVKLNKKSTQEDDLPNEIYGTEDELDEILQLQQQEEPLVVETSKEEEEVASMTESPFPGTTLAAQCLPLPQIDTRDMGMIWDTPGLIVSRDRQKLMNILARDGTSGLANAVPMKKMKPTTYRLSPGRSIFLGGLLRVDYSQKDAEVARDHRILLTWYGALPGHLTKTENATSFYVKHAGGRLSPPRGLDAVSQLHDMEELCDVRLGHYVSTGIRTKSKDSKVPKRTNVVEVAIPGFGWFSISAVDLDGTKRAIQTLNNGTIRVHGCMGIDALPRQCLFPYEMSKSTRSSWVT